MSELILVGHIFIAFILGTIIGFEREYHQGPAGMRTYACIAVGACLFGIISTHTAGPTIYKSVVDPSRIAAQIVSGIGFIGGGVIFRSGVITKGLTTAATIWVTAAIGLAVAFKMLLVPIFTTFIVVLILSLSHFKRWENFKRKHFTKNNKDLDSE